MQVDIGLRLLVRVFQRIGVLHALDDRTNGLAVEVGRAQRRKFRRLRLDEAAIFEIVGRHPRLVAEQLGKRRRQGGEELRDGGPAPLGDEEPALLQLTDRLAQRRARHVELLGEIALRGQALTRSKAPFQSCVFDVAGDGVGEAWRSDGVLHSGSPSPGCAMVQRVCLVICLDIVPILVDMMVK